MNLEKTNISIVSDELRKILLQSDIDLLRPAENGPERKLSSKLMIDHSSLNCRRYLTTIATNLRVTDCFSLAQN